MSQIATAYAPDFAALVLAEARAVAGDRAGALAALRESELPTFGWSGYAVVILHEWLIERGLLPATSDAAPALQAQLDPLIWISALQAQALSLALRDAAVSDTDLAAYWAEWTGDHAAEATEFMAAARDWLTLAAEASTTTGALVIMVQ